MNTTAHQKATNSDCKIYYYFGAAICFYSMLCHFALTNYDIGKRFKNFNHHLPLSYLIASLGILLVLLGITFYLISKSKYSDITSRTVKISFWSIIGLILLICLVPLLETFAPTNSRLGDIVEMPVMVFAAIGVFTSIFGVISNVIVLTTQLLIIVWGASKSIIVKQ